MVDEDEGYNNAGKIDIIVIKNKVLCNHAKNFVFTTLQYK